MDKIDYIVSCYFGNRRILISNNCTKIDKLYFIKKHINAINTLKVDKINKIVFTINIDDEDDKNMVLEYLQNINSKITIDVIFNENIGFSYKAWETAIIQNIDDDVDYFFLIEDDYLPVSDHFYNYFLDCFTKYTGYVCELVFKNHASGPNGIIRKDICQELLKSRGSIFDINDKAKSYVEGEENQHNYLRYLTDSGYIIKDIVNYMKVSRLDHYGKILTYGNPNRLSVIEPLFEYKNLRL